MHKPNGEKNLKTAKSCCSVEDHGASWRPVWLWMPSWCRRVQRLEKFTVKICLNYSEFTQTIGIDASLFGIEKNSWDSYKFQFSFYAILILTVKFANFKEESGRRLGMFKLAQTPHSMGTIWFFYPRLCEKEKRGVGVYLCNKSLFKGMGGLFDIWRKVFDQGDT